MLVNSFVIPAAGATGGATFVNRMLPGAVVRSGMFARCVVMLDVPLPVTSPVNAIVGAESPSVVAPLKSQVPVKGTPDVIAMDEPVVN